MDNLHELRKHYEMMYKNAIRERSQHREKILFYRIYIAFNAFIITPYLLKK
jgi:hypothetical protein